MNDKDVFIADINQGAGFVLAVLEFALFVRAQDVAEMTCHLLAERVAGLKGKKDWRIMVHRFRRRLGTLMKQLYAGICA